MKLQSITYSVNRTNAVGSFMRFLTSTREIMVIGGIPNQLYVCAQNNECVDLSLHTV